MIWLEDPEYAHLSVCGSYVSHTYTHLLAGTGAKVNAERNVYPCFRGGKV